MRAHPHTTLTSCPSWVPYTSIWYHHIHPSIQIRNLRFLPLSNTPYQITPQIPDALCSCPSYASLLELSSCCPLCWDAHPLTSHLLQYVWSWKGQHGMVGGGGGVGRSSRKPFWALATPYLREWLPDHSSVVPWCPHTSLLLNYWLTIIYMLVPSPVSRDCELLESG